MSETSGHPCPDCRGDELPFRQALGPLLLITGIFFFNFTSRVILSPFLVGLEHEFSMHHAEAGRLFLYLSLGMAPALALSGFVARALTHRRTIILSAAGLGLVMVLISQSQGAWQLKAGIFCMGGMAGLYFASGITAITSVLRPRDWGKGLSVHELAPNGTFIVVPALAAALEGIMDWRTAFLVYGLGNLCMAGAFRLWGRGGEFKGQAPSPSVLMEVMAKPAFWLLTAMFGLAVAASIGPYNMLPLYLVDDHGFTVEEANALLAASRLPGPVVVLMVGLLVDRIGARRTAMLSLGSTGLMTVLLGLFTGLPLKVVVLAQPALTACFFPAGLTAASLAFRAPIRNVAVSLIVPTALVIGNGLTPAFMGAMGDHGLFGWSFVILGAVVFSGIFLTGLLRFSDRREHERGNGKGLPAPPTGPA